MPEDVASESAKPLPDEVAIAIGTSGDEGSGTLRPKQSMTAEILHCPPSPSNPLGCKVHVLGTAHASQESADEAHELVMSVRPDVVMLELCNSRQNVLTMVETPEVPPLSEVLRQYSDKTNTRPLWGHIYAWLLSKAAKEIGVFPGTALDSRPTDERVGVSAKRYRSVLKQRPSSSSSTT